MRINRLAVRLFGAVFAVLVVAGCTPKSGQIPTAALPAGKAWAEGKEIFFVHTEPSDADVAEKLTNMMKSPVIFVPSLAKMPADALAQVYVFTNGVAGNGPFGFQSDVFDSPPGTTGYFPAPRVPSVAPQASDDVDGEPDKVGLRPEQHKQWPMDTFTFLILNNVPFAEASVVKYVMRWREQGGVEELRKARRLVDMMIEMELNRPMYTPKKASL